MSASLLVPNHMELVVWPMDLQVQITHTAYTAFNSQKVYFITYFIWFIWSYLTIKPHCFLICSPAIIVWENTVFVFAFCPPWVSSHSCFLYYCSVSYKLIPPELKFQGRKTKKNCISCRKCVWTLTAERNRKAMLKKHKCGIHLPVKSEFSNPSFCTAEKPESWSVNLAELGVGKVE